MATWNGAYNGGGRIEYVYSVGSVSQNTTSVTVSVTAYLRMQGNNSSSGSWPMSWSGAWGSGSSSPSNSIGAGGRVQIRSWSGTVSLTDSTQSRAFQISAQHYWGTTSATLNVTIPARYARTPTSVSVRRNSDANITVSWTRQSTYTSVVVQRQVNTAGWTGAGTAQGNATSLTLTDGRADRRYRYRVQGRGGSGASAWSGATAYIYTTPGQVTGVSATRSGNNIVVGVSGLTPWATHYDIEDNGIIVGSAVPRASLPWTHVGPDPAQTHRYRVRARVSSGGTSAQTLIGAYSSYSNTVQLQAPPASPTNLAPNGGVVAAEASVRYSWRHNPVDSSEQTQYQLRYRPVGGSWTTLTSATSDEYRDLSLTAPGSYEWEVRTRGSHATYGPWSATATVTVVSVPTVAIITPGDGIWTEPTLTAAWSYDQGEGRPQTGWRVQLTDVDADEVLVDETGTGPASSYALPVRLVRATHYRLRVWVANSGIWSEYDELSFETVFVPPASPVVDAVWNEEAGSHDLTVWAGDEPGLETTVRVVIDRSVDDGETWELVTESPYVEGELSLSDFEGLSHGTTIYRVTGYSVADEAAEVEVPVVSRSRASWTGPLGGSPVRLPWEPVFNPAPGRRRATFEYEGASSATAYSSHMTMRTVAMSGQVPDQAMSGSASRRDLETVNLDAAPVHVHRSANGDRVYGVPSVLSLTESGYVDHDGETVTLFSYSFTVTETRR